jgi:hypothetical protein
MNRKIHLGWITVIGLCSGLWIDSANPGQAISDRQCGQDVHVRDVLVLDLEPMRTQPDVAQEFVEERAGEFILINTKPEVIIMRDRPSKDPNGVIRQAQKFGVRKGCNLVLVLKTGPYFGKQRGRNHRIKDMGYAFVVMGMRTGD